MAEPARKLDEEPDKPNIGLYNRDNNLGREDEFAARRHEKGIDNPESNNSDSGYGQNDSLNENQSNNNSVREDELAARRQAKAIDNSESNPKALDKNGTVSDQEAAASGPEKSDWDNKVLGKDESEKAKGKFSFVKKKGPLAAIILTLGGGAIGIMGLLSPGLLIIQFKETMVSKFNTQLTGMNIRTRKIITSKMTGGACNLIPVACKYKSMSTRQVARFNKAGIEIIDFDTTNITGRVKPKTIRYDGDEILAQDFYKRLNADPNFRLSVKKAYNPLFASFYDKIWNKALFYIDKTGVHLVKGSKTAKLTDIQIETQKAADLDNKTATLRDSKPVDGDAIDLKKVDDAVTDVSKKADDVARTGKKAASKIDNSLAINFVKATAWIDNACVVFGAVRAVGFAAKTVRAVQLITYASLFLKMADQMKAGGNPDPEDVAYLGDVLTTEVKTINSDGSESTGTATDSFGYKYAAYGEIGNMPDTTTQFLTGGGFAGSLIGITAYLNSVFTVGGLDPYTTCRVSQNILVQIGSAVAGIAIIAAGAPITVTGKMILQGAATAAVYVAVAYLPALLADIVAGVVVDDSTVGHLAGDAITSGSSAMMGKLSSAGGNAPLTVDQAIAHANLSNKVASEYAEEDRLTYSPFDITSPNTFLGSFARTMVPYLTKMSSISGTVSSISSLTKNSFASAILPKTYAATAEEFSLCQDYDYRELNLATDPFCNPYYGVPVEYLENIDPADVLIKLHGSEDIDQEKGEIIKGSKLEEFIEECIDREEPIGYSGYDFQDSDGKKCIIGQSNYYENLKYFYLYLIDKRVEDGMSGDDEMLNMAYEMGLDQSPNIAFYDGSSGIGQKNTALQSLLGRILNLFNNSYSESISL
jgi:hypothetical protein